eukprot:TRINITY_DN26075_c0_g1_i2.p1 TRINITY_DN26075_c0_g1~~TRINITY_DN26075_c0_g1_i2.p1  ORF type:complete len:177 (+),score=51.57 TRINITY_DN26075_c0_g1_i2:63-593(+)
MGLTASCCLNREKYEERFVNVPRTEDHQEKPVEVVPQVQAAEVEKQVKQEPEVQDIPATPVSKPGRLVTISEEHEEAPTGGDAEAVSADVAKPPPASVRQRLQSMRASRLNVSEALRQAAEKRTRGVAVLEPLKQGAPRAGVSSDAIVAALEKCKGEKQTVSDDPGDVAVFKTLSK